MPPREPASVSDALIGATLRQPLELSYIVRIDHHAIRHAGMPVRVITPTARADVEKPAGEPREIDVGRILVLDLDQTALTAAVAERLPLGARHLVEPLGGPEGNVVLRCQII